MLRDVPSGAVSFNVFGVFEWVVFYDFFYFSFFSVTYFFSTNVWTAVIICACLYHVYNRYIKKEYIRTLDQSAQKQRIDRIQNSNVWVCVVGCI